jgi:hypothetical protein
MVKDSVKGQTKMSKYTIIKISFLVIAIVLIACGREYWSQCKERCGNGKI